MKPFFRCSSRNFLTNSSWGVDIPQSALCLRSLSSLSFSSLILWSYLPYGLRVSEMSFENTSRKSWYSSGTTVFGSVSGFVTLLSWYSISCIDIADISAFCFFDLARCMNSALLMNAKSKGLRFSLACSTLGFSFFEFVSSFTLISLFLLDFGFWGMPFGFYLFSGSIAFGVFATLLTPQVLGRKYSINSISCLFDNHFNIFVGLSAFDFSARGCFVHGSSTLNSLWDFSARDWGFSVQGSAGGNLNAMSCW